MHHWSAWPHVYPGLATELSGYTASALVLLTFSMQSMRMLRVVAIGSNVSFIAYAVMADLRPILVLHALLLPMNILRLRQTIQQHRPLSARSGWIGRYVPQNRARMQRLSVPEAEDRLMPEESRNLPLIASTSTVLS